MLNLFQLFNGHFESFQCQMYYTTILRAAGEYLAHSIWLYYSAYFSKIWMNRDLFDGVVLHVVLF